MRKPFKLVLVVGLIFALGFLIFGVAEKRVSSAGEKKHIGDLVLVTFPDKAGWLLELKRPEPHDLGIQSIQASERKRKTKKGGPILETKTKVIKIFGITIYEVTVTTFSEKDGSVIDNIDVEGGNAKIERISEYQVVVHFYS